MRDVSWENLCHQFPGSTRQHRPIHQIYSCWSGGGRESVVSVSFLVAQSQHAENLKHFRDFLEAFANARVSFNFDRTNKLLKHPLDKKVKVNKKNARNEIEINAIMSKLFTLALVAEIHEQLIWLSASSKLIKNLCACFFTHFCSFSLQYRFEFLHSEKRVYMLLNFVSREKNVSRKSQRIFPLGHI